MTKSWWCPHQLVDNATDMVPLSLREVFELASAWADADPDPVTANKLREWIDQNDERALRDSFESPLVFGTAGLRGVVGPGPAHMNTAVVRRVTRALVDYLAAHGLQRRPLVVGHDARLDSARFAQDVVAVARAAGCRVVEFGHAVPTPLVAYAALAENAAAGVVVTASHNPREYNGYKVYGPAAFQIVSPMDTQIAERMNQMPVATPIATEARASVPGDELLDGGIVDQYVTAVLQQRPEPARHRIRIAYTPLHGVGWQTLQRLFHAGGHTDLHPLPAQVAPDGRFPTVAFPNPEEPGTLDLGIQFAERISAQVLIANDPDADRLALALPDARGEWHALTGNQLGVILMDYLLERALAARASSGRPLVVTTVVSSPLADAVARAYGADLERTMTGFKWLWSAALELSNGDPHRFAIAWEEALGYSTHTSVRDKDGIAAGLIAADWVAMCHAGGLLPWERLGQIYREHGAWASRQVNVHCAGLDGAARMRTALQSLGAAPPGQCDGVRVTQFEDYRTGAEKRPPWRGEAELFVLGFEDGSRLLVRPSGTEPKIKLYVDVPAVVRPERDPFTALENAGERAERLARSLLDSLGLDSW